MPKSDEKTKKPKRRKGGGGRKSTTLVKVLAGAGGFVVLGGLLAWLRKYLDNNNVDKRWGDALAVVINGIGLAATREWLQSAFIGGELITLILLGIDQVSTMSGGGDDAPANADRPDPELVKAIQVELQKELPGARNYGGGDAFAQVPRVGANVNRARQVLT